MDQRTRNSLEQAKAYVFSCRIHEAYNIFRRYFDRLPFAPEEGHAEYIGLFVRVLFELGKDFELKFYLNELEKLYETRRSPLVAYPLGVVYSYSGVEKREAARQIFDDIIRDPAAKPFHPKARMMLADYYLNKDDLLSCRMLIDSIEVPSGDAIVDRLVAIWKAVVLRREKKLEAARDTILALLETFTLDDDWYSYFSAKLVLGMIFIEMADMDRARAIVAEVRQLFDGKRLKMVQYQLEQLEALLAEKTGLGKIRLVANEDGNVCTYANKSLPLSGKSPSERLLLLLIKRGFLDKAIIVKSLYDRHYDPEHDDKLIYYHVHALRKRLRSIGLPPEAIESEGSGYRLLPEVEWVQGEL